MNNTCTFSLCRRYRYTLVHLFDELLAPPAPRLLPWIGLNPSTADESHLDATLRRIRKRTLKRLSRGLPFDGFVMLNLFAFRATLPEDMLREPSPIGDENDAAIRRHAAAVGCVVACWGGDGSHLGRDRHVMAMLRTLDVEVLCLGTNDDGTPCHPLYLPDEQQFVPFAMEAAA